MRNFNELKITITDKGHVSLSIATLLNQYQHVTAVDVISENVKQINKHILPIHDKYIKKNFAFERQNLTATYNI